MKSICIKTNNSNLLNYLLTECKSLDLDSVCFSANQFKSYQNVIIHYTGEDTSEFISRVSSILSCLVMDEMEDDVLKSVLLRNYFYFDALERKKIISICYDLSSEDFTHYFDQKYTCLMNAFTSFLQDHKSVVLTGFVHFRLREYQKLLEDLIDEAVNIYLVEKEYEEFISLLKLYISSQKPQEEVVHLIYSGEDSFLLDAKKNKINVSEDLLKAKYLSDISFSTNDYLLNTLLNLLPKQIFIHLIDGCMDEFIQTLLLIFDSKVKVCTDCPICHLYQTHKIPNLSHF